MTEKPILQRVSEIVGDALQIATDEVQLTIAKIKPQATDAGIGAALLVVASVLALTTVPLFALLFVALFAWLFSIWVGPYPAVALGFLTEAVLLLIGAAVFGLLGKSKAERLSQVKPTLDQSKARLLATVDMATGAIASGTQKVAALSSSDRPELDH